MRYPVSLTKLVLVFCIVGLTGCNTTSPATSVSEEKLASAARSIMGNDLPGTRGATQQDQNNIDNTVAGGCAAGVYKKAECAKHTRTQFVE